MKEQMYVQQKRGNSHSSAGSIKSVDKLQPEGSGLTKICRPDHVFSVGSIVNNQVEFKVMIQAVCHAHEIPDESTHLGSYCQGGINTPGTMEL